MAIELSSDKAICYKCGTQYGRLKGNFPVNYSALYKGVGYIPICKSCIDKMYDGYLAGCNDPKRAVRQMCRKLDLYWSESVYDVVSRKSTTRTMMTQYIAKINSITYAGKSYDDTLSEEGTLWNFTNVAPEIEEAEPADDDIPEEVGNIPEDVVTFWGKGYSGEMYDILEEKFAYYKKNLPPNTKIDIGVERLLRQVCIMEAKVDKDSAAGRSVEKTVETYAKLLGDLNLKPAQQKDDSVSSVENTPFGVWIRRWENQRPIPEPDPELKDADGIVKYVLTWFYGHLAKMFGIKNAHSRLYDEEVERLRVDHPEYEDEDDDDFLYDIFSSSASEDDSQSHAPDFVDADDGEV